ncbi:MAG TPA: Dabb family protein [Ilumatobacteraceae bacterium]
MFMMQLKEGVDVQPYLDALEALPSRAPTIRRTVVAGDLGLTKQYGHNCSFSWIAEFDDQAGWEAYLQTEAHDEFGAMFMPNVDAFLVNQWQFPDEG